MATSSAAPPSSTSSSGPSYADCVSSLRTSLSMLESSVDTLHSGIADYPRLISILKTVRHYELIPHPSLAAAESSLRDEIGPSISLLLDRADRQLERQARRIETLKARAELQAGRLSHGPEGDDRDDDAEFSGNKHSNNSRRVAGRGGGGKGRRLDGEAALRARMVRQRREALKYSVERMEMEVGQKERELRTRLGNAGRT